MTMRKSNLGWIVVGVALLDGMILPNGFARELSPAEYKACVAKQDAEFVRNCYREKLAENLTKSRAELPVMPSQEERLRDCWGNLGLGKSIDKYYPEAEGVCGPKPK
jgi:hypothetical protein